MHTAPSPERDIPPHPSLPPRRIAESTHSARPPEGGTHLTDVLPEGHRVGGPAEGRAEWVESASRMCHLTDVLPEGYTVGGRAEGRAEWVESAYRRCHRTGVFPEGHTVHHTARRARPFARRRGVCVCVCVCVLDEACTAARTAC
jgi:hypothetical protein